MALLNFDARSVAPATGFDPVPPGWYNVIVDESSINPTKEPGGSYLKVRYSILDGQHAGRKIYGMITLQNANAQAVEIGLKQLSALAHSVGQLLVQDSQQLHNLPLKIKVKIRPAQGEYEPSNAVTQWENINAAVGENAAPAAGAPVFNPGVAAPAMAQPAQQPWAQPAGPVNAAPAAAAPTGMPSWGAAPVAAQPAAAAPAGATSWQQPAAGQPWAQPGVAPAGAAPAGPAAGAAPGGFNPQGAVPPWAQR